MLDSITQRQLLQLARATLARHLGRSVEDPAVNAEASDPKGAFVSLHTRSHDLRGCIGTFAFDRPLIENVRKMAVACGTEDPRFPPVRDDELDGLVFEISAMTPPEPIDASAVVIGTHGLLIQRGMRRGVLLPQVAVEHGFSREEFLRQTCRKAGLPDGAWSEPGTDIRAFTSQVLIEYEA
jgi:AmmeMemoRadiSam system protein A